MTLEMQTEQGLQIEREIIIEAPISVSFEAVLQELGPGAELPDGSPFPMLVEPWPGGRWYRDLGNKSGHLWGHVQVIKPPALLELCGPMFMSYPAINHVQYRLTDEGKRTRLKLTHRAIGQIPQDVYEGAGLGWEHGLKRVRQLAEQLVAQQRGPAR